MKITNLFILLILINLSCSAQKNKNKSDLIRSQHYMEKPVVIIPNAKIKSIVKNEIISTLSADFTGDGKMDFICCVKLNNNKSEEIKEFWLDSEYRVLKILNKTPYDYDFYWFLNLDNDPDLEIFHAFGYSDGIDYAFYKQNLKGEDKLIFYFNPVIIDSTDSIHKYWGYPWDISDIQIKKINTKVNVLCSVDHDIKRSGEITYSENQILMPVIFFVGKSSQKNSKVEEIRNEKWADLEELQKIIMK